MELWLSQFVAGLCLPQDKCGSGHDCAHVQYIPLTHWKGPFDHAFTNVV